MAVGVTLRLEEAHNTFYHLLGSSCVAFPYDQHLPPKLLQFSPIAGVAGLVLGQFLLPEPGPGGWLHPAVPTAVAVPEASVDEDYLPASRKNEVGCSRQIAPVQAVPVAQGMQHASDNQLRLGVLASDTRHAVASLLGCQHICHGHMV